ncbi:ABC transporter ATP-binding protein/permease [Streptosporangium sp. NBC_01495]|uniref:ABC transporter ATP-binding protein n=1 Tax=Streptosporangium sp. NBC_01495 TaxID=2903899 RepID=UPI002E35F7DE|nr:ABC transporter ATP-binding protein [Streptosporangium sp. NBC_01495]
MPSTTAAPTAPAQAPDGLGLLKSGLRGSRTPATRIAGWSVLEAAPALVSGWATATALDQGFLAGRPGTGLAWLALLGVLYLVRAVAERAMFPHLADIVEPLRDHLVRRLVEATLAGAAERDLAVDSAGVSRLTRQVESVRGLVGTLLRTARPLVVTLLAAIAGLVTLNPVAAVLVLPPLLVALAVFPLSLRAVMRRRREVILAEERVSVEIGAVLGASRDVAALGAQEHAAGVAGEAAREYMAANVAVARLGVLRVLIVFLGGHVPLLALLVAGSQLVGDGGITAGELVGAVTYVTGYLVPALQSLTGSVGEYWAQLSTTLTRLAAATAPERVPESAGIEVLDGTGLEVDRLTFGYGPHAEPVLRDLSLTIPPGDHLAVVGASGIGKSTLAALLAGLRTPDEGGVRIGGVPVGEIGLRVRSETIAFVPQEAYVFAGTVRENLCYLNPAAGDADLASAARALGATELVERLGGYDAEIDDPATQLSSGERQLLVLVRVHLSPAGVVILDEATCHLDPVAEARAEAAFAARPGTLVVVAHRLASAYRARRVLLLDGSRADLGTHAELLAGNRKYADLVGHWSPTGQEL